MITDKVTFAVPTSIAPWHPSTKVTLRAIRSAWQMLGEEVPPVIMCDQPSPLFDKDDNERYQAYVGSLRKLGIGRILEAPEYVGQAGLVRLLFNASPKGVLYYHHDDWKHITPSMVDSETLIRVMDQRPRGVQMVKFHKRAIVHEDQTRRVDHIKVPVPRHEYGVPLLKTSGWGTSPHFATRYHYETHVLPRMETTPCPIQGRRGIENVTYEAYRRQQLAEGFERAHHAWRVFIYGEIGDGAYIKHLGIQRTARRRRLAEEHNIRVGSGFTYTN